MDRHHLKATLIVGAIVALVGYAAAAQRQQPLPQFDPEKIAGDVRIVLLSVDRCTHFSAQYVGQPGNRQGYAIPGVRLAMLVEDLAAPLRDPVLADVAFYRDGQRLRNIPTEPGVVSGGYTDMDPYRENDAVGFAMPTVADPAHAFIRSEYLRGLQLGAGPVDIHITTGFGDEVHTFTFKNVPIHP